MLPVEPQPEVAPLTGPGAGGLADRSSGAAGCVLEPQGELEKFNFSVFFLPPTPPCSQASPPVSLCTPTVPDVWSGLCELVARHPQGPAEDQKSAGAQEGLLQGQGKDTVCENTE